MDLYYSFPFDVKSIMFELPERKSAKMSDEARIQYTYRYDLMMDSCYVPLI